MPRELITVQIGQCGNQVGCRFWELALKEHAANNPRGVYDESLSSFFKNVDTRYEPPKELPVGDGTSQILNLKARAVIVDMEEGVVNEALKGPLRELFDEKQLLTDVSGSGNNWAHGFGVYGPQYRENLLETIRRPAEQCDSLQSFLILHSLGGGTGSGLGSYMLQMLADEYPDVYRFATSIFPSEDDDVITSPYNAMLTLSHLAEDADCVFPVDNQSLAEICGRIESLAHKSRASSSLSGPRDSHSKPFDAMNGIAANLLLGVTSSVRFEGSLNVDLNEITNNLVPYPRMHFLLPSMSPFATPRDVGMARAGSRALETSFSQCFSREHQLLRAEPRRSTYLACGMLFRGDVTMSDVQRNMARIKPSLRMVPWNTEGFKIGLCGVPPADAPLSVTCLSNNCCVRGTFTSMQERFMKLYKRKVYVHHYTRYMEAAVFDQALEDVHSLIEDYAGLDSLPQDSGYTRMRPLGTSFL
uniref:Tubulin epsilon n=1 Tax=Tetraselmis sp. GSL018 TaxID=582737 RepID=A0A061RE11_9CHLO